MLSRGYYIYTPMKNKNLLVLLGLCVVLVVSGTLLVVHLQKIITEKMQAKHTEQMQTEPAPARRQPAEERPVSSRPAKLLEPVSEFDLQLENTPLENKSPATTAPKKKRVSINPNSPQFIKITKIFEQAFSEQDSRRLAATMMLPSSALPSSSIAFKLAYKLAEKMPNPPTPEEINRLVLSAQKEIQAEPAEKPLPQLKEHTLPTTDISTWEPTDCKHINLPKDAVRTNLTCYRRADDICAAHPNGRPFICLREDVDTRIRYEEDALQKYLKIEFLNKTDQQKITRRYYDGKLTAEEHRDLKKGITHEFFIQKDQIVWIKWDNRGMGLFTYYFKYDFTYRLEGQNYVPPKTGTWTKVGNDVFINNQKVLTLPDAEPAPDLCQIFENFCTLRPLKS